MGNADESKKSQIRGGAKTHSGFSTFSSSRDGEDVDPQEYAALLDFYDNSFRNIAEGEVVKGTVVKVTPTEVIVDVGFKSEGIIPIEEFIDETGRSARSRATSSTCCSSGPRTARVTSSSRARKPRR
jgi:S1 RNA binding family protein